MYKYLNLLILAISAFITSTTNTNPGLLDQVKGFFSGQRDLPLSVSGMDTSKPVRSYDPERRLKHWKTTIAALKAYGISKDSDTMRWAYHNLNRAENAQPYGRKLRQALGSTPYKKQLGRTYDRPSHARTRTTSARTSNARASEARTRHDRTSDARTRTIHVKGYDRTVPAKAK